MTRTLWRARPRWAWGVTIVMALLVAWIARVLSPDSGGVFYAANAFQMVDWLVMKSLDRLLNKLSIASNFNTDYNKEFDREFAVNETVRVKLPQRWLIRDGTAYAPQPMNRVYTTVACNQPFGIDFEWDSFERALKMERGDDALQREYVDPAMDQIAQEIDSRAALYAYQNSNNIVGILGTDPADFDASSAAARQRLVELGCPAGGDKICAVSPAVMRALKKSAISYFNPVTDIAKQFRTGIVGSGDGFDWYESVSLYQHTASTWAAGVTVNGAGQSGSTLNVTCTTGDTFSVGDSVAIASVNPVNPGTRRKVGSLTKQFAITVATVGAASAATLNISPAIFGPGSQYQNVDALPANAAALTLFPGTSSPNGKVGTNGLAFHKNAFALVGVSLETPKGSVEVCRQYRDEETGIAVRFLRQFDGRLSKMINRFDVLLGFGSLYPDNCSVRILSA